MKGNTKNNKKYKHWWEHCEQDVQIALGLGEGHLQ